MFIISFKAIHGTVCYKVSKHLAVIVKSGCIFNIHPQTLGFLCEPVNYPSNIHKLYIVHNNISFVIFMRIIAIFVSSFQVLVVILTIF